MKRKGTAANFVAVYEEVKGGRKCHKNWHFLDMSYINDVRVVKVGRGNADQNEVLERFLVENFNPIDIFNVQIMCTVGFWR